MIDDSDMLNKMRKKWRRRCTLGGFPVLVALYTASTNNVSPSAYHASDGLVLVQVDLLSATASLQVPCYVDSKSMMNIDYTTPLVDVIPRYSFNITIQTPVECQGGKERSTGIENMKSFLRYMFPLSDVDHVTMPTGTFSSLDAGQSHVPRSDSMFATHVPLVEARGQSPDTRKCNNIRGRQGTWKYNSTYGKNSWYTPQEWIRSNELTNGPYNHSSWTWESDQSSCPLELSNFRGFCEAMHVLNITRIMALGDSIEFMRSISFFHTMGVVSHVHSHLRSKDGVLRHAYKFDCPSVGKFSPVDFVFHRVNHLMPLLGSNETRWKEHDYGKFICYGMLKRIFPDDNGFCPWVKEYMGNPETTLLVGGVGPHFHRLSTFEEHLQNFFDLLKLLPRKNDYIWLRTVLPGHEGCKDEKTPIDPLNNYQEYRKIYRDGKDADRWYGWNLHEVYNQRLEAEVIKIKRDVFWTGPKVELFDIYWMTALRRDGHPSDTDCLHYLLPGPPDWWNHLFYSNLRELANL